MTLGEHLLQKRKQRLLNQTEASTLIGVNRTRYVLMEKDRVYSYAPKTLVSVALFLEKSTDWVLKHLPKKN